MSYKSISFDSSGSVVAIPSNRAARSRAARFGLSFALAFVIMLLVNVPAAFAQPGGGCLVRTAGFWGTHPEVTRLFEPISVCGLSLTNVAVATAGSATEDLCVNGQDAKAADTSPQQLQLIRQCTAAALNFRASLEGGGSCSDVTVSGTTITAIFDRCCDAASLCTAQADGSTISNSGCVELLEAFNSGADTIDCSTLNPSSDTFLAFCPSLGANGFNANSGACSAANGNGFVNPRSLGPN